MGIMRVKHLKRMKYRNLRPGCPVTCRHKNCLMTYRMGALPKMGKKTVHQIPSQCAVVFLVWENLTWKKYIYRQYF
ncbi:hypothetical protein AB205_0023050 [Aquarana catesbeiana]|uniref:Uncharacterized protein n=1 Tax=Aquarana catesbeiana TaxID=8400 RepID=A0A2G9RN44_AQUCT|nr:hypothetical protein AB205_0023050 [Aquarana catesbeiana]